MRKKNKISSFSLIVAFLCVALAGAALIPLLPLKLSPSYTLPGITVNFRMPDNSARVIEMEVTSRLEAMLARIKGVKEIHSRSGNGWGEVSLELDKHTDIENARFEVSTIIRQLWGKLPERASYPQIRVNTPEGDDFNPFLIFTINSQLSPAAIQKYTEENIQPRLAGIAGIYQMKVTGANPMEWQLEYDNDQLLRLGITVEEIQKAIYFHYRQEFLGITTVTTGCSANQWMRLNVVPATDNADTHRLDVSSIPVAIQGGRMISLDQLVKAQHLEAAPESYYRINGLNSIYLAIVADKSANQLELSKKIQAEMKAIRQTLPSGYEIHTSYDASEYIQKELNSIYFRSGLTILILLLFVLAITRNFRYLFLITVSLTVNLLIAVVFYYLLKLEIQLYSLAGITISLSLIIDNTIVITDHILHRHNLKAYLSILAATLTTMAALCIIFFLNESLRLILQDFAIVIMVNLAVSLLIALFFVPSLIEKIRLTTTSGFQLRIKTNNRKRNFLRRKRGAVCFAKVYTSLINFSLRRKAVLCVGLILLFGIPVYMLPEKIEHNFWWSEYYNRVFGSSEYKEKVKPVTDKLLGGTLRLFTEKVFEGSYFSREGETVLYLNATLPNGSTLEQMNALIEKMEVYLTRFREIRQFQTNIYNARRATISIYFTDKYQHSGFPYILKSDLIAKALQLGGGSWSIYGLDDQGFSNNIAETAGSFRIKLTGYNYDELEAQAAILKEKLLLYPRIKEITISSEFSYWKDDYREFCFNQDTEKLVESGFIPLELFSSLRQAFDHDLLSGTVPGIQGVEKIKLFSVHARNYNIWDLLNKPFGSDDKTFKVNQIATIGMEQQPQEVVKKNQQYQLCLQYEYIGANRQGEKMLRKELEAFNVSTPMGYTARQESFMMWGAEEKAQYALLFLVIAIIFVITSILFNSLRQPFAIIFVVPISYIGVFLIFYLLEANFNQGGFASFILLCGITVNASIYIVDEYNSIRKDHPALPAVNAYVKAWNAKIIPVLLTVLSTVFGFVPFIVGPKDNFWYPLAIGVIGGLSMSLIGIFVFLPLFVLKRSSCKK